jgi:hypothetical protein
VLLPAGRAPRLPVQPGPEHIHQPGPGHPGQARRHSGCPDLQRRPRVRPGRGRRLAHPPAAPAPVQRSVDVSRKLDDVMANLRGYKAVSDGLCF